MTAEEPRYHRLTMSSALMAPNVGVEWWYAACRCGWTNTDAMSSDMDRSDKENVYKLYIEHLLIDANAHVDTKKEEWASQASTADTTRTSDSDPSRTE